MLCINASGHLVQIDLEEFKSVGIPTCTPKVGDYYAHILSICSGLSFSESQRLIKGGGVTVGGEKVIDKEKYEKGNVSTIMCWNKKQNFAVLVDKKHAKKS